MSSRTWHQDATRGRFCHRDPSGVTRVIDLPNTYATELSLERRTIVLKLHGGLDGTNDRDHERFVALPARTTTSTTSRGATSAALRSRSGSPPSCGAAHFLFLG